MTATVTRVARPVGGGLGAGLLEDRRLWGCMERVVAEERHLRGLLGQVADAGLFERYVRLREIQASAEFAGESPPLFQLMGFEEVRPGGRHARGLRRAQALMEAEAVLARGFGTGHVRGVTLREARLELVESDPPRLRVRAAAAEETPMRDLERAASLYRLEQHGGVLPRWAWVIRAHLEFLRRQVFPTGNARIGRLLTRHALREAGLVEGPLPFLSDFLWVTKDRYRAHVRSAGRSAPWDRWLAYLLVGIAECTAAASEVLDALLELDFRTRGQLHSVHRGPAGARLLNLLARMPRVTPAVAVRETGCTARAVRGAIDRFERAAWLRRVKSRNDEEAYVYQPLREVFEDKGRLDRKDLLAELARQGGLV